MYFGGCLLVVSSILFVAVKHQTAIIVGRCLAGFAHGIIYNATITHAAENAVKQIRGMVLSSINCTILSGIFMSTVLRAITTPYIFESDNMDNNMIVGICGLILSILGIVSTTFLTYESIPYLLRRGNEPEAVVNLMMLRNESYMTPNLVEDLNEMRTMVLQDKEENMNVLANGNASAMGKMMVLRVLATLTSNYLINSLLIIMIMLLLQSQSYYMAPVILSGSRFAASFIPVFSTDLFKRKIHLTVSSVTSGTLMLALAIIFASVDIFLSTTYWVPAALCIVTQIFVSLGIDPMQHLLLSEAFSTSTKPWSIAWVTSIEYVLQILFIVLYFVGQIDRVRIIAIFFVTAGVMLALAIFLQLAIPETFGKSIKETRDLFRK
ncbi:Solute carrier family 2, facilitated glucose transporter member 2 [Pseudolycoriella hygida]|uniref:Solute carrier family 2, facilitated glucose transporter member 2 n=1 Tax=Pseudolycoriella hygida TaxID=35572 RepID=A0A9Q0RXN2_9DIPT|nr:Solute carrier family 2, facilitated glucose transporter member 2 [Pseudolycoriella hygida]